MSFKKIFIATSIYPSNNFTQFAQDYFSSIINQTNKNFTCLFFLDCIHVKKISKYFTLLRQHDINFIYLQQEKHLLSPIEIRVLLIHKARELQCDLLLLSDFDEAFDSLRVEKTIEQIEDFDFAYNSFYPTNFSFRKITKNDFYTSILAPEIITSFDQILNFNFIGFGSLAICPQKIFIPHKIHRRILAFDWFLITYLLFQKKRGKRIYETYTNYRQHQDSYIGIGKPLSIETLNLGVLTKKSHYLLFQSQSSIFYNKLQQILELELFLKQNTQKYIRIINENFDFMKLSWWENIKTLEEIQEWI